MKFFIVFALIATACAKPSLNHGPAADAPHQQQQQQPNILVRVDPSVLANAGGQAAPPPP